MNKLGNSPYKRYTLAFFLLISSFVVEAQVTNHKQLWVDFAPSFAINESFSITSDFGYRTEPALEISQIYARGFVNYQVHNLVKLSAGAANFFATGWSSKQITETRTSQFACVSWPKVGGFTFQHRIGLDQRWFYLPGHQLTKFIMRSRYRIGLASPRFGVFNSVKRFYALASFEVLRNTTDIEKEIMIDHEWATLVLGAKLSDKIKVEAHALLINANIPAEQEFMREFSVLRLRLHYKIR